MLKKFKDFFKKKVVTEYKYKDMDVASFKEELEGLLASLLDNDRFSLSINEEKRKLKNGSDIVYDSVSIYRNYRHSDFHNPNIGFRSSEYSSFSSIKDDIIPTIEYLSNKYKVYKFCITDEYGVYKYYKLEYLDKIYTNFTKVSFIVAEIEN